MRLSASFTARLLLAVSVLLVVGILTTSRVGQHRTYEAVAISAIRAVVTAQHDYEAINRTYCATLECLAAAKPGAADRTPFVQRDIREGLARRGYRMTLHAGPREGPSPRASSPVVRDFAVVVSPIVPDREHPRAFCGDASGTIQSTGGGVAPRVEAGRCVGAAPLR
jgi:hypothetical protein